jgi:hypothetical protein
MMFMMGIWARKWRPGKVMEKMGLDIVINDKPNKHREKQDEHPRQKTGGNSEFSITKKSKYIFAKFKSRAQLPLV